MATLKKPDLLLLDEHTAALDPKTARIVLQLNGKNSSRRKTYSNNDYSQFKRRHSLW